MFNETSIEWTDHGEKNKTIFQYGFKVELKQFKGCRLFIKHADYFRGSSLVLGKHLHCFQMQLLTQ